LYNIHIFAFQERHQDYRTEIDARAATFHAFEQFGNQLIRSGHYASEDVRQRMDDVNEVGGKTSKDER
jgi:spectrin alpha